MIVNQVYRGRIAFILHKVNIRFVYQYNNIVRYPANEIK